MFSDTQFGEYLFSRFGAEGLYDMYEYGIDDELYGITEPVDRYSMYQMFENDIEEMLVFMASDAGCDDHEEYFESYLKELYNVKQKGDERCLHKLDWFVYHVLREVRENYDDEDFVDYDIENFHI